MTINSKIKQGHKKLQDEIVETKNYVLSVLDYMNERSNLESTKQLRKERFLNMIIKNEKISVETDNFKHITILKYIDEYVDCHFKYCWDICAKKHNMKFWTFKRYNNPDNCEKLARLSEFSAVCKMTPDEQQIVYNTVSILKQFGNGLHD